jgi:hypothetical protein
MRQAWEREGEMSRRSQLDPGLVLGSGTPSATPSLLWSIRRAAIFSTGGSIPTALKRSSKALLCPQRKEALLEESENTWTIGWCRVWKLQIHQAAIQQ